METGLSSAPSLHWIKIEQNTRHVKPKNGCILSLQNIDLLSELSCPVQVKQESDPSQSEYLPCPKFEELKKESTVMNELIKMEPHDDSNSSLTITTEASHWSDDNLPHGLIPPVEMEDDEYHVKCPKNVSACRKSLNKKRSAVKVKLHDSNTDKKYTSKQRKAQKQTKYHCVKGHDGRTLKTHTHTGSEEAFWCETCGKQFRRYDLLSDHRRGHSRKRPYACDQCGMRFSKPAYLKIHLRRHAGERAFPCDKCDKRFFDKYDLAVHQRDHTGERPYECRECGKSFKRIYILNKHKKTHSNEKPFECNVCGKAYKYGYSYRLHRKTHSA